MPYEISPGPRDNVVLLKLIGKMTYEDMMLVEPLGLHLGPRYILLDASELDVFLPEGFFEGAAQSYFVHPNMKGLAFYVKSQVLRTAGIMVAHMTRQADKVTIYQSYDKALEHIMQLAEQAELADTDEGADMGADEDSRP